MAKISWRRIHIEFPTPKGRILINGEWVTIPLKFIATIVVGGFAGLTTAGLALLWKSLPALRREELLSGGTEAVLAAFNNRTANREG